MSDQKSKGHQRVPGVLRTLSGRYVDLTDLTEDQIHIEDIAWGLGRTLRYGGHIRQDYTVATHCIVMSYAVPPQYALEALLHDASEAYMGDIIWPVKALFPEISQFEDEMLHTIMTKYGVETPTVKFAGGPDLYVKRPVIADFDNKLLEHECFSFGRDGVYHGNIERAWLLAATTHDQWWHAPMYAYLERFAALVDDYEFDLDKYSELWFPNDTESDAVVKAAEEAVKQMDLTYKDMSEEEEELMREALESEGFTGTDRPEFSDE